MGIIQKFFEALLDPKAATWSAGVSFNRSNPLPLDKWSVFQSMDDATAYAESNAVAYPGQVIAVYNNGKMVAYVLSEDVENAKLVLEPIGIIPTGDGAISVDANGVISIGIDGVTLEVVDGALTLVGFEDAPEGAQLVKASDGTLSWVKPDLTTVEGLQTAVETLKQDIQKIEQALNPTDEDGNPVEGGLVSDVKDLEDAVGEEAVYDENGELISEATGIFKDIEEIEDKIGNAAEYDNEGSLIDAATGLYAELDKKANKVDVEAALDLKADAADVADELAKKADADAVAEELAKKANAEDVYTKTEADEAAEEIVKTYVASLDHLERKIVVSEDSIEVDAEDADRYIYMVPNDRGSYDEYMVINGALEKVGDWTIDLGDYATIESVEAALELKANASDVEATLAEKADAQEVENKLAEKADAQEVDAALELKANVSDVETALAKKANTDEILAKLAEKVDKVNGSRLMKEEEGTKLAGIEDGAQKNYINSVSDEFNVTEGHLTLVEIAQGKVQGLANALEVITNALENKVEIEEGSRLINADEIAKLASIKDLIKNVDTNKFTVDENGKLLLNGIKAADIIGLADELATKVDKVDGSRLITSAEAEKLEKLVFDEETGEVEISGSISAANVQELYDAVVRIVTGEGTALFDKVERTLLDIEAGAERNVIHSADDSQFVVENRNLRIKSIEIGVVNGLQDALDEKASISKVNNVEALLNSRVQRVEERVEILEGQLTWKPLTDENV